MFGSHVEHTAQRLLQNKVSEYRLLTELHFCSALWQCIISSLHDWRKQHSVWGNDTGSLVQDEHNQFLKSHIDLYVENQHFKPNETLKNSKKMHHWKSENVFFSRSKGLLLNINENMYHRFFSWVQFPRISVAVKSNNIFLGDFSRGRHTQSAKLHVKPISTG